MDSKRQIAQAIAIAFLAGPMDVDALVDRATDLLSKRWRWIRPLAQRFHTAFPNATRPRVRKATNFLLADAGFERAWLKHEDIAIEGNWLLASKSAEPFRYTWPVQQISSPGELADWLGISPRDLEWFADARLQERRMTQPER